jgi:hypothetical protein
MNFAFENSENLNPDNLDGNLNPEEMNLEKEMKEELMLPVVTVLKKNVGEKIKNVGEKIKTFGGKIKTFGGKIKSFGGKIRTFGGKIKSFFKNRFFKSKK